VQVEQQRAQAGSDQAERRYRQCEPHQVGAHRREQRQAAPQQHAQEKASRLRRRRCAATRGGFRRLDMAPRGAG
jgi:hypothetical protein